MNESIQPSVQPWFDDYSEEEEETQIDEYDLTSAPNDFNVLTINSFIESKSVKIPGFQRNFVWDIKRASKLIESLILGLPVPQLFLYEEGRNSFLVIDGQQRLMSIYYFIKMRFPKEEKRAELRQIFEQEGTIPEQTLYDEKYFSKFDLKLSEKLPNRPNKFRGMNYATLGEYKSQFDLRPIRNIIVKQNTPTGDDSSIYEIFNRLNTGGINLTPQEIRTSLYHSGFYEILYRINSMPIWRHLLNTPEPDIHMKDLELLLRSFAMLIDNENYAPSMIKFLNQFSKKSRSNDVDQNNYLRELFISFLQSAEGLPNDIFLNKRSRRFNIALFEAVFTAMCEDAFHSHTLVNKSVSSDKVNMLATDRVFLEASQSGTTNTSNVKDRLNRARIILAG